MDNADCVRFPDGSYLEDEGGYAVTSVVDIIEVS